MSTEERQAIIDHLESCVTPAYDPELKTYDYDLIAENVLALLEDLKIHRIGEHGALGMATSTGSVCAECEKPIEEEEV